ncbi:putative F-box protein At3g22710 [Capsella rubella]|uniref:putative F-box protein At3g22710 n=1 Tax=Capsella rubella TaxID=81985 RepID=UPI000CD59D43|nr:putative F-box protein At3g22710 [Capsella rubella]
MRIPVLRLCGNHANFRDSWARNRRAFRETKVNLPWELIEEILYRVPTKSLKRLGSTCKQWNALFENQRFTKKHFDEAPKQSMVLMLKDFRGCPDDRLVVWNPCLRETRWIQHKADYMKYSMFALGYQNNKSCRSYKILKCCWNPNAFEVYEFSSDSWKVFDKFSLEDSIPFQTGVCLKGNSYFVTIKKVLLSFDFATESFSRVCRLPVPFEDCDWIILSVAREEQLSMLHQNYRTSKMDIWMANSIDDTLSWKKTFSVELIIPANSSFYLIDEERKVVVCCNVRHSNDHIVKIIIGEDNAYYTEHPTVTSKSWTERSCIFNYVPSLVRIQ